MPPGGHPPQVAPAQVKPVMLQQCAVCLDSQQCYEDLFAFGNLQALASSKPLILPCFPTGLDSKPCYQG